MPINDKLTGMGGRKKAVVLYKWIKIAGILSFIPFVLAAGPLAGYFAGRYLQGRFNFPTYVLFILITIGFIGSVSETVKIIKIALKAEEE